MKILTIDVGTGTQDIYLYDSRLDMENGFKLVVPSPTMIVHRRLAEATRIGAPVALTGVTMGGGPSQWAAENHLRAGHSVYATPDAARSFNDDLDVIAEMGITVIGDDEVDGLPSNVERLALRDVDIPALACAFAQFGVSLDDLDAAALAVFDHGAAPPGYSDRQFRFDYIQERIEENPRLSAFAFRAEDVPARMTRLRAVLDSARDIDTPLMGMDTAPAAVLGALLDPAAQTRDGVLVANVGNLHTLAFRLNSGRIEGTFEHHTGMLDQAKLDGLLMALADGTLQHKTIFQDHGHGAYIAPSDPLMLGVDDFGVVVTGPRRTMLAGSQLRPFFATPYGDMMLAGCFGQLAAMIDVMPELGDEIRASLAGDGGRPPWELT